VRLFEHADFEQAILRATDIFAPRARAQRPSKKTTLCHRSPPDHRRYVRGQGLELVKRGIDRDLKKILYAIRTRPALTFVEHESRTIALCAGEAVASPKPATL
jgi:hypothetical protein